MLSSLTRQRSAFAATNTTVASLLLVQLIACGTRSRVVATNPALSLAPTCTDAVAAFADRDHVPYDYYEVALVTAEGNSVYTGNGDLLKAMRSDPRDSQSHRSRSRRQRRREEGTGDRHLDAQ